MTRCNWCANCNFFLPNECVFSRLSQGIFSQKPVKRSFSYYGRKCLSNAFVTPMTAMQMQSFKRLNDLEIHMFAFCILL